MEKALINMFYHQLRVNSRVDGFFYIVYENSEGKQASL